MPKLPCSNLVVERMSGAHEGAMLGARVGLSEGDCDESKREDESSVCEIRYGAMK